MCLPLAEERRERTFHILTFLYFVPGGQRGNRSAVGALRVSARATQQRRFLPVVTDSSPRTALQISTPLDSVAVTDHAEALGETRLCHTQGAQGYDSLVCALYRGDVRLPMGELLQSLVRLVTHPSLSRPRKPSSDRIIATAICLIRTLLTSFGLRITMVWRHL